MRLEEKTLLHDIRIAAERIESFVHEKDFSTYRVDEMLRLSASSRLSAKR